MHSAKSIDVRPDGLAVLGSNLDRNRVSTLLGQLRSVSTTLSRPFQNKLLTRSRAN
jgi:hypothetical protein